MKSNGFDLVSALLTVVILLEDLGSMVGRIKQ